MTGHLRILSIEPTVFFVRHGAALRQLIHLTVENVGDAAAAVLAMHAADVAEMSVSKPSLHHLIRQFHDKAF